MSHEAPLAVLREDPGLVPELLRRAFGAFVPDHAEVEVAETDLTQVVPAELRADLVLVLRAAPPERSPVMGIVVEVQRGRDDRKRTTWPLYLAALHARLGCPTCLVVLAGDEGVARWAGEPIGALHPGMILVPLVLGPAQVPRVDQAEAYRHPWLAVLSALVHGNRSDGVSVALAALVALSELPVPHAILGIDLIMATLDAGVRTALEAQMNPRKLPYDPPTDFLRKPFHKGRLEATRELLQEIAGRRLGGLSDAQRERIETCEDVALLQRMTVQIAEATTHDAVVRVLAGE